MRLYLRGWYSVFWTQVVLTKNGRDKRYTENIKSDTLASNMEYIYTYVVTVPR